MQKRLSLLTETFNNNDIDTSLRPVDPFEDVQLVPLNVERQEVDDGDTRRHDRILRLHAPHADAILLRDRRGILVRLEHTAPARVEHERDVPLLLADARGCDRARAHAFYQVDVAGVRLHAETAPLEACVVEVGVRDADGLVCGDVDVHAAALQMFEMLRMTNDIRNEKRNEIEVSRRQERNRIEEGAHKRDIQNSTSKYPDCIARRTAACRPRKRRRSARDGSRRWQTCAAAPADSQ